VERTAAGDRRATDAQPRVHRRAGAVLRAALYRRLAEDDDRAAYWVRHVRIGILLSEVAAISALGYLLLTDTPGHDSRLLYVLVSLVIAATPTLFLLPLAAMMHDSRGPLLFYGWSAAVTALVAIASRTDGGGASPLFSLLFLTLAYMALAYPPAGVVAMGTLMLGTYVLVVAPPHITLSVLFIAVVMAAFTMICAMASANSWTAHDRQVQLIRAHQALAATDPLTGCSNRRAFLGRLEAAVVETTPTVVGLVDLDGFKGVNDRGGHAEGDRVLQRVTAALSAAVRESDTVARLGGDEFAVLAEVTATLPAADLAERLRQAVAFVGQHCGVTASVGVTEVIAGDDVHDLLFRADAAMYRAKTAGGNRVTAPG
jgi:diguanylate cyclase (GGDEF)-like protein